MDTVTFQSQQQHARPLTTSDSRALEQLRAAPLLADCAPLTTHLLAVGQKLEQEAMDISAVRDVIGSLIRQA